MMEGLQQMVEMNVPSNLSLIAIKLPCKLQERWRAVAYDLLELRSYRTMHPDMVSFIERQVKFSLTPFRNIQEVPWTTTKTMHHTQYSNSNECQHLSTKKEALPL